MKHAVRWLLSLSLLALFVVACGESVSPTAPDAPPSASKDGKAIAQTGPGGGGGAGPGDCGSAGPGQTGCGNTGGGGAGPGNPGLPGGGGTGGGGGGTGGGGGVGGGGSGDVLPAPPPGTCPFRDLGSQTGLELVTGLNETAGDDFKSIGSLCGLDGAEDVAFAWRAPATGCFQIDTNGSDYDTVLRLYDSCTGSEFRCNDDAGIGLDSLIYHPFTAGESTVIIVDGFSSSSSGTYIVNIDEVDSSFCFGATPTPTPTPPPPGCNQGFMSNPIPVTVSGLSTPSGEPYAFFQAGDTTGFGNGQSFYTDDPTFVTSVGGADLANNAWIQTASADAGKVVPNPLVSFNFSSTCLVTVFLGVDRQDGTPVWLGAGGYFATSLSFLLNGELYTIFRRDFGTSGSVSLGPPEVSNANYFVVLSTTVVR